MNSPAENLVEISGVEFAYGPRKLLKGLSLKIQRGKLVAILGASGSGKSTLLRLIGGQAKPDRGTVKVAGQVVHDLDTRALYALRRKMGMMFQAGGLFTDISVFEDRSVRIIPAAADITNEAGTPLLETSPITTMNRWSSSLTRS